MYNLLLLAQMWNNVYFCLFGVPFNNKIGAFLLTGFPITYINMQENMEEKNQWFLKLSRLRLKSKMSVDTQRRLNHSILSSSFVRGYLQSHLFAASEATIRVYTWIS